MDLKQIPILLKRYDFQSKMEICQLHSSNTMSLQGLIPIEELRGEILPWDLETFALFSVITFNEYNNRKFENKKEIRNFTKIINTIKTDQHPRFEDGLNNNRFLEFFLIVTGLTQFQLQENILNKIYRYSYIFNFKNENLDMKQLFHEKFGCNFNEFIKFGIIIHCYFSKEFTNFRKKDIYNYIFKKYNHVIEHLTINRSEFVTLQEKVTKNINQYVYGFKYFYQFPFISYEQNVYLPLPHLIMDSVTTSLLFRLTEGNNKLRESFGKEVLENYILQICKTSEYFNEVIEEKEYTYKRNQKRTLDIMIRKNNQCLMLDSKSMSPRTSLRNLTEKDIDHTINRLVDCVIQVYKHITKYFLLEYNPFETEHVFSKNDIFGAVIIFEDSYIRREIIMSKAAEKLKIDLDGDEYEYLCANVKLLRLYELEKMIFQNDDILQLLSSNRQQKEKWFDFSFIDSTKIKEKQLTDEILQIDEQINDIYQEFVTELAKEGIIN
ncbi:hypothetical protein [Bacillus cereus]|uniref:hypothetical protein n=1 Tax=Bacillus cereus TaxID=1396 RepID=UPI000BF8A00C|nr:hypothetical protein [Bacillus cereus]PER84380.1 hypothetical protein CN487_03135 [Bacillus cereus]